jgi:Cu/Ag efflux protein CusF
MKRLLMLACALAIATSAFAGQAKNAPTADYSGIIEKYDAATKTLTVKRKDKQGEFVITDASVVELNKAKADAAALTPGQKVEVVFVMDGAKKIAQKVKVSGSTTSK